MTGVLEHAEEARQERSGADAVDVVIPEEDDALLLLDGLDDPRHGAREVGQAGGVVEVGEAGLEENLGRSGLGVAPAGEDAREERRDVQRAGQFARGGRVGLGLRDPAFGEGATPAAAALAGQDGERGVGRRHRAPFQPVPPDGREAKRSGVKSPL
ncbi:MAG: hypothetical protein M5U26_23705 [Planctomycetota bacterium]|nr:hypothetical protein [Planctomycetota bacterium]